MKKLILGLSLLFATPAAQAQNFESMQKATELGTILAAEQLCGLSFNQDAVADWIDQNTDPSDMGFPGTLQMMVDGSTFQNSGMSGSALTAHCRSVERTSRHFGFID